jgi:hypothetical protein
MRECLEKRGEKVMSGETISNQKPSTKFETKRVLITPTLAKATMDHNLNNRTLNPVRVDEFVFLIKAGRFQCTHQGIALDDNNCVIDGQHRLAAIIKSGCSVYMLVSKGVPIEARLAIDTGKPRTALAISKLVGRPADSNTHYAVARILKYGPIKSSQMHVPTETLFDLVDTFSDGLNFVLPCGKGINSTILAVVARASYTKDKNRLRQFLEIYRTSRPQNEGDTAAIKLKVFMANKTAPNDGGKLYTNYRQYIYQITESAIIDFLNSYPTRSLKETKTEKFPLPAELDGWNSGNKL